MWAARAGVIVGGAVPPLACVLTWTRCTRLAAIISARPDCFCQAGHLGCRASHSACCDMLTATKRALVGSTSPSLPHMCAQGQEGAEQSWAGRPTPRIAI